MRREEDAAAEAHRAQIRTRAEVEAEAKRGYYDRVNNTRETLLQRVRVVGLGFWQRAGSCARLGAPATAACSENC